MHGPTLHTLAIFLVHTILAGVIIAQQRVSDLQGYQDFRFGEARPTVESRLKKAKAIITETNQTEIKVQSRLNLDNVFFFPISLEKSFSFHQGKLWNVTLRYQALPLLSTTDSVSVAFLRQLHGKYGHAQIDTTMEDEMIPSRFVRWDFPSGYIVFVSLRFTESVTTKLPGVTKDLVAVSYSHRGISERIELEKREKTAREF
jgi:hypothetical protein